MTRRPVNAFDKYHAHVYFDEETIALASRLCREAGERFGLQVGRLHRRPVGPHPSWSCQLVFDRSRFDRLIPWLDAHRNGLTVLVHPVTGDDLADHTIHAAWLGGEAALDLSLFGGRAGR